MGKMEDKIQEQEENIYQILRQVADPSLILTIPSDMSQLPRRDLLTQWTYFMLYR